jgi:U-box domain
MVRDYPTPERHFFPAVFFASDLFSSPPFSLGHTYERSAIARWLQTSEKSPLTGGVLPHKELVPNYGLLNSLQEAASRAKDLTNLAVEPNPTASDVATEDVEPNAKEGDDVITAVEPTSKASDATTVAVVPIVTVGDDATVVAEPIATADTNDTEPGSSTNGTHDDADTEPGTSPDTAEQT